MSQLGTSFFVFEGGTSRPPGGKTSSLINKPENIHGGGFSFSLLKPFYAIQTETESKELRSMASNAGNNSFALKVGVQQHRQPFLISAASFSQCAKLASAMEDT